MLELSREHRRQLGIAAVEVLHRRAYRMAAEKSFERALESLQALAAFDAQIGITPTFFDVRDHRQRAASGMSEQASRQLGDEVVSCTSLRRALAAVSAQEIDFLTQNQSVLLLLEYPN